MQATTSAQIPTTHKVEISEASGTTERGIYPNTFAIVANYDPDHYTVNGHKVRMVAPQRLGLAKMNAHSGF